MGGACQLPDCPDCMAAYGLDECPAILQEQGAITLDENGKVIWLI